MTYTLIDLSGVLVATAACGLVLVLPAIALGQITNAFGFRVRPAAAAYALALILAYALLPLLDSLLSRYIGLGAALACNLGLAAFGAVVVWRRGLARPDRPLAIAAGVWLAVIAAAWVDLDWGGGLYPSLLMIDTVKHAATVRTLVDAGMAPPVDPFFLRAEPGGYYYYFYIASALAERLCGGLIDSRAAVAGQIFWTGLALAAMVRLLLEKAGLAQDQPARRTGLLTLALMSVGGLQLLPVLLIGLGTGRWLAQVNWWNEQVTSLPLSLLWVPHHVGALIATWAGLMLLATAAQRRSVAGFRDKLPGLALAGCAFASAAGLSVWVTAAAGAALAVWACVLAFERRWGALAAIAAAGALSLAVSLPYLADLVAHRAQAGPPVALTIRPFPFTDGLLGSGLAGMLGRLATLPLHYTLEFGLLAVGACMYWRRPPARTCAEHDEMRRLLAIAALAGLAMATFLKSTIINNDLAWRAVLFAQVTALLWSIAAFAPLLAGGGAWLQRAPAAVVVVAGLGYAAVAYDLMALRAFHGLGLVGDAGMRRDPHLDRDVRAAYTWLARDAGRGLVVQHNPDAERAFGYGLYGRARVAVADRHNARIFGAAAPAVTERLAQIEPVFTGHLQGASARQRLAAHHVGAIVVTSADPVWRDAGAWIWSAPVLYAARHVRVVAVATGATP